MFKDQLKQSTIFRLISAFLVVSFALTSIVPPQTSFAQSTLPGIGLPPPGAMVLPSTGFMPPTIKGLTIDPTNPLHMEFIVNTGQNELSAEDLRSESSRLIKYFLASLTTPENQMWVNLSPYEKERIIPESFGQTEMGRDLLAQDYLLKQLTASLIHPEDALGEAFWRRVRQKAYERFGTTDIPMNTYNKVWVVPERAVVYEQNNSAFVIDSHLKVMMEEDYLALRHATRDEGRKTQEKNDTSIAHHPSSIVTTDVLRQVVIPEIEKEVNQGKSFAQLRQIYHSMILATWYKRNLRQSLLGQVFVDQNKIKGIDLADKTVKDKIYQQYLEAFEKGVYDFIKEDYDPTTQQIVPRKYFSGGFAANIDQTLEVINGDDHALLSRDQVLTIAEGLPRSNNHRVSVDLFENATEETEDAAMTGDQKPDTKETITRQAIPWEGSKVWKWVHDYDRNADRLIHRKLVMFEYDNSVVIQLQEEKGKLLSYSTIKSVELLSEEPFIEAMYVVTGDTEKLSRYEEVIEIYVSPGLFQRLQRNDMVAIVTKDRRPVSKDALPTEILFRDATDIPQDAALLSAESYITEHVALDSITNGSSILVNDRPKFFRSDEGAFFRLDHKEGRSTLKIPLMDPTVIAALFNLQPIIQYFREIHPLKNDAYGLKTSVETDKNSFHITINDNETYRIDPADTKNVIRESDGKEADEVTALFTYLATALALAAENKLTNDFQDITFEDLVSHLPERRRFVLNHHLRQMREFERGNKGWGVDYVNYGFFINNTPYGLSLGPILGSAETVSFRAINALAVKLDLIKITELDEKGKNMDGLIKRLARKEVRTSEEEAFLRGRAMLIRESFIDLLEEYLPKVKPAFDKAAAKKEARRIAEHAFLLPPLEESKPEDGALLSDDHDPTGLYSKYIVNSTFLKGDNSAEINLMPWHRQAVENVEAEFLGIAISLGLVNPINLDGSIELFSDRRNKESIRTYVTRTAMLVRNEFKRLIKNEATRRMDLNADQREQFAEEAADRAYPMRIDELMEEIFPESDDDAMISDEELSRLENELKNNTLSVEKLLIWITGLQRELRITEHRRFASEAIAEMLGSNTLDIERRVREKRLVALIQKIEDALRAEFLIEEINNLNNEDQAALSAIDYWLERADEGAPRAYDMLIFYQAALKEKGIESPGEQKLYDAITEAIGYLFINQVREDNAIFNDRFGQPTLEKISSSFLYKSIPTGGTTTLEFKGSTSYTLLLPPSYQIQDNDTLQLTIRMEGRHLTIRLPQWETSATTEKSIHPIVFGALFAPEFIDDQVIYLFDFFDIDQQPEHLVPMITFTKKGAKVEVAFHDPFDSGFLHVYSEEPFINDDQAALGDIDYWIEQAYKGDQRAMDMLRAITVRLEREGLTGFEDRILYGRIWYAISHLLNEREDNALLSIWSWPQVDANLIAGVLAGVGTAIGITEKIWKHRKHNRIIERLPQADEQQLEEDLRVLVLNDVKKAAPVLQALLKERSLSPETEKRVRSALRILDKTKDKMVKEDDHAMAANAYDFNDNTFESLNKLVNWKYINANRPHGVNLATIHFFAVQSAKSDIRSAAENIGIDQIKTATEEMVEESPSLRRLYLEYITESLKAIKSHFKHRLSNHFKILGVDDPAKEAGAVADLVYPALLLSEDGIIDPDADGFGIHGNEDEAMTGQDPKKQGRGPIDDKGKIRYELMFNVEYLSGRNPYKKDLRAIIKQVVRNTQEKSTQKGISLGLINPMDKQKSMQNLTNPDYRPLTNEFVVYSRELMRAEFARLLDIALKEEGYGEFQRREVIADIISHMYTETLESVGSPYKDHSNDEAMVDDEGEAINIDTALGFAKLFTDDLIEAARSLRRETYAASSAFMLYKKDIDPLIREVLASTERIKGQIIANKPFLETKEEGRLIDELLIRVRDLEHLISQFKESMELYEKGGQHFRLLHLRNLDDLSQQVEKMVKGLEQSLIVIKLVQFIGQNFSDRSLLDEDDRKRIMDYSGLPGNWDEHEEIDKALEITGFRPSQEDSAMLGLPDLAALWGAPVPFVDQPMLDQIVALASYAAVGVFVVTFISVRWPRTWSRIKSSISEKIALKRPSSKLLIGSHHRPQQNIPFSRVTLADVQEQISRMRDTSLHLDGRIAAIGKLDKWGWTIAIRPLLETLDDPTLFGKEAWEKEVHDKLRKALLQFSPQQILSVTLSGNPLYTDQHIEKELRNWEKHKREAALRGPTAKSKYVLSMSDRRVRGRALFLLNVLALKFNLVIKLEEFRVMGTKQFIIGLYPRKSVKELSAREDMHNQLFAYLESMRPHIVSTLASDTQTAEMNRNDDKAMVGDEDSRLQAQNVGGIDLNPQLLDLQIKRDGNGVPLPIEQQPIQQMNIEGFYPIIIQITPVPNLPLLLGFDFDDNKESEFGQNFELKGREPERLSLLTK